MPRIVKLDVPAVVTITLGILTTTTHNIQGRAVREYLGIVSGESLFNLYPVRHTQRITWSGYQRRRRTLEQSIDHAIQIMAYRAGNMGATVVVSVVIDFVQIDIGSVVVIATGTAVRL